MPTKRQAVSKSAITRPKPATTKEGRELQLVDLAVQQAEEMLLKREAPTAVVLHYLKLATTRDELERERLKQENQLAAAKTGAIQSQKSSEELYSQAIDAMRRYSGGRND